MIVPSKNQKTYGVVHTENYFSFLGFCKKVNSDKIQKVDVFVDNVLIDTIVADKHIEKIEDIYELEGFGFEYILPNEYIGQKNLISFKNNETKEDLQNSPYELIDETHPKFNEMAFSNSLKSFVRKEKKENMNHINNIGFLMTEENFNTNGFITHLKELLSRFPKCQFNGFYFNSEQKDKWEKYFNHDINYINLKSIYQLMSHIEILILTDKDEVSDISKITIKHFDNCYIYFYITDEMINNTKIINFPKLKPSDLQYKLLMELQISKEIIINTNYNFYFALSNEILEKENFSLNNEITYYEYSLKILEICILNKTIKQFFINSSKKYYEMIGVLK